MGKMMILYLRVIVLHSLALLGLMLYFIISHDDQYPDDLYEPPISNTTAANKDPVSCPPHGIVYGRSKGRLGNKMWEYAATLVVAQRTGLQAVVRPDLRRDLDAVFVNLTVPARNLNKCEQQWNKDVHSKILNDSTYSSIQIPFYHAPDFYGLHEIVVKHRPDVRSGFIFHQHLMDHAQEVLRGARADVDTVYVGVHVRRTDYITHLRDTYNATLTANASFYHKAMDVFRRKYKNTMFIVVSDDVEWCRSSLQGNKTDVITVQGTPGQDMATLAACNHSINDYGSFGNWGAMLSGGDTIVYDLRRYNDTTSNLATLLHWMIIS